MKYRKIIGPQNSVKPQSPLQAMASRQNWIQFVVAGCVTQLQSIQHAQEFKQLPQFVKNDITTAFTRLNLFRASVKFEFRLQRAELRIKIKQQAQAEQHSTEDNN